jgi:formylmethanofuran dehydrogenase subunit E
MQYALKEIKEMAKYGYVECDKCHSEVHEDTVEIVDDQVLCDRCRKPAARKMPFWFMFKDIKFGK